MIKQLSKLWVPIIQKALDRTARLVFAMLLGVLNPKALDACFPRFDAAATMPGKGLIHALVGGRWQVPLPSWLDSALPDVSSWGLVLVRLGNRHVVASEFNCCFQLLGSWLPATGPRLAAGDGQPLFSIFFREGAPGHQST